MELAVIEVLEAQFGDGDAPPADARAHEGRVLSADEAADGWGITTDDSRGFVLQRREMEYDIERMVKENPPQPGDLITFWTTNGTRIIGVDLRGERLYRLTAREVNLDWALFRARNRRQNAERFERDRADLDAAYDALPRPLKVRIDRFRESDPDFRAQSEGYEMAAVGDAPKIARALAAENGWVLDEDLRVVSDPTKRELEQADEPTQEAVIKRVVQAFHEADFEEQKRRVPDLAQGHSGNTFNGAVMMAHALLIGREL